MARRAQLAMGVAIGEWIVFTLEALDPDPRPKQYLEAAWLGTVHFACCPSVEFVDREWSGPVRGPLHLMMALINDALHFEGASPSENAAWLSTLAQLVVPPDAPYRAVGARAAGEIPAAREGYRWALMQSVAITLSKRAVMSADGSGT